MIPEAKIEAIVDRIFSDATFPEEPKGLYDPLRYMISLGGKRLRPKLCLLIYSLWKHDFDESITEPAIGLEFFHNFTLIHDDIMDRSPLRRGHDTVWKRWSEDTAILSGDVMCIDAYKRVAQAPPAVLPKALALFSKTAAEVCDGQQLDMDFEKRGIVPMADYMQMIGLKTGVLIACSAQLGALIAGADERSQKCLYDYGYDLGLAFQVADDYLDAYGDQKVFGKPIGGDILNEKKSWLTVKADELGAKGLEEALAAPATTAGEKQDKIDRVMEIYDSVGIADAAREAIGQLSDSAIAKAADASMDAAGFEALKRFADSLVGRAK